MPGCILVGCRNSSAKKVKMCYFPRDNNIRAQWIKQIGIKDWSPTINSALCQYHFKDDMWEPVRQDGKLKLKSNAIPTIFGDKVLQLPSIKRRAHDVQRPKVILVYTQPSTKERSILKNKNELVNFEKATGNNEIHTEKERRENVENNYNRDGNIEKDAGDKSVNFNENTKDNEMNSEKETREKRVETDKDHEDVTAQITEKATNFEDVIQSMESTTMENSKDSNDESIERLNRNISVLAEDYYKTDDRHSEKLRKLEKLYEKTRRMNRILMKRMYNQKQNFTKKIRQLQDEVNIHKQNPDILKRFLNDDQIKVLSKNYKKTPKWCDDTIAKAYQLRFTCGRSGYNEFIKQGMPLPSLRTLSRKLEGWQSENVL